MEHYEQMRHRVHIDRNASESIKGSFLFLISCCSASALGGLLFGYDLFVISGAKDLIVQYFQLSTLMEGWFVSSAMLGAMAGCLAAGAAIDYFGRKKVLIAASATLLACSIGCGLAWSTTSLILFRWIGGLGVGISSMVCPLYISELSPPRMRGRMVTLFQLAICIGIVLAIVVNKGLFSWHDRITETSSSGWIDWMLGREVWRSMLGIESLPALCFLVTCLFIAESPRWLVSKNRYPEALTILSRINGPKVATAEMADIAKTIGVEHDSWRELFRSGPRRALFMALFLAVVSEFSGITTIWNFGPEIIRGESIQLTNEMSGMIVIASSLSLFTFIAVWWMDHAGRRPLLFWGTLGCFISLLALGGLLHRPDSPGFLKVVAAATFVACFAFSMGPIKWVFMSEIFPMRVRGRAVAVSSLAVWTADAILNLLFPILRDGWGKDVTFYIFAAILVPQFYFVWKIMPETKGRSLEDIERSWHRPIENGTLPFTSQQEISQRKIQTVRKS
jgi:sugar porter (SP) family MFS transporter